jgi:spore maturation protein CgeB
MVERERPDVLISVQRDYEIWLETLEIIRARGDVATISWTTDDSWKYGKTSRFIGPAYHAMTTTYEGVVGAYSRAGIPVLLTQWAARAEWLREPIPSAQCLYPVSFVGAAHGKRKQYIERLREKGIEVACFGTGWSHGPVDAERIPEIMRQSGISLNFANSFGGAENQIKARTFEVPGAGGLLLTEYAPGLERLYGIGTEIAVFHNEAELAERIVFFQNHPAERDAVAMAGFQRTKSDHTYDQRMKQVVEFALQSKSSAPASAPFPDFELAVGRHEVKPWQTRLRDLLLAVATSIWGEQRGPRAARRVVFEASLYIVGKQTYSASGFPGRLFPGQ